MTQAHTMRAEFREGKLIGMYSGHVRSVLKTKMHTCVHPSFKSNIKYIGQLPGVYIKLVARL